jgi:chromosome segregation ATPase
MQEDMTRAEQLSTKYKTLSYDHERLIEQHRLTKEATAHAQREMETGKAKAESAQKRLTEEEEQHRKSKEDHQRLKLAMAYLRTTTANEVKRKEKEIEKTLDRWQKIANDQAKLGAVGAGIACANLLPEQQSAEAVHYILSCVYFNADLSVG